MKTTFKKSIAAVSAAAVVAASAAVFAIPADAAVRTPAPLRLTPCARKVVLPSGLLLSRHVRQLETVVRPGIARLREIIQAD